MADLVLVRPMRLPFAQLVVAAALLLGIGGCATNGPQLVRSRDNVTYWDSSHPGPDPKHHVDMKPQPVGGMRALISRLDYPRELRHKRITGVVWVQIALDADGRVTSATIVQSANPVLDEIVLRAVRETPWQPAMKDGKAIAWRFRLPITFTR